MAFSDIWNNQEYTIKRYTEDLAGNSWLVPQSTNFEHQRYRETDDVEADNVEPGRAEIVAIVTDMVVDPKLIVLK